GAGGGVMGQNAAVTLDRTFILDNRSTGGVGSTNRGPAGGGGVYLSVLTGSAASTIVNSIIAANLTELGAGGSPAAGGGGGGLFLQGVQAAIEHATVAGNHLGSSVMQGSGMVLLSGAAGASVSVSYSIVADHTDPASAAALHVQPGSTLTLTRGIFA